MRHGISGAQSALALGAVLCTFGAACGGAGGGGDGGPAPGFSAQLLPRQIAGTSGGSGDVAFTGSGDALVVGGGSDDVHRLSRADGSTTIERADVSGGTPLLSVVPDPTRGAFYAGDEDGTIYVIDNLGATPLSTPPGAGAIHGMVFAPSDFGAFASRIIAATETGGIVAVDPTAPGGSPSTIADPGPVYSDLAFLDGTLYAVDYTNGEIDTVTAAGVVTTFEPGFSDPDGIAADAVNGQLLVADSGGDALYAVSVPGAVTTLLGRFDFAAGAAPSGLAFDGIRNLLLPTTNGMLVVRGATLPGFQLGGPVAIAGTDAGFGGLTLDGSGNLVGTANGAGTNQVFRIPRSGGSASAIATDLGAGEDLYGVASDAATGTFYVGSQSGSVYAVNDGGTSVFATLPDPVLGLAIAPETFAPFGGHLVATTDAGDVYEIDLATGTANDFANLAGAVLSDLVFAADGTLRVVDPANGEVLEVDAAGVSTTVSTGASAPDGVDIDHTEATLLVADSGDDDYSRVVLPGGGISDVADRDFDAGPEPSGIVFDGLGSVLLLTGEAGATVRQDSALP